MDISRLVPVRDSDKTLIEDAFYLGLARTGVFLPVYFAAPRRSDALDIINIVLAGTLGRKTNLFFERRDGLFVANPHISSRRQSFVEFMNFSITLREKCTVCFLFGPGGWNSHKLMKELDLLSQNTAKYKYSAFINVLRMNDNGEYRNKLLYVHHGKAYTAHKVKLKMI